MRLPTPCSTMFIISAIALAMVYRCEAADAPLQTSMPAVLSQAQIASALAADRPQLAGPFAIQPHRSLGPETELSREVYQRLLRYVHLTNGRFQDWPRAAGCRYHKEDGDHEYPIRQNADVALGYSVLLAGNFDETIASVPRERIEMDLRGLLRYIAITHRVNLLPTGSGKPWGDHWQSAYWAAIAGHAAWLAWDRLDVDTRIMTARFIAHEADRFNTRPPDSGWQKDTKAEENAWNSEIIALAACMFPRHPHAPLWRERAIVYMINSFVREEDRNCERVVDGRAARDRIEAVTLYPDYTLENHNRIHPDYMTTGSLLLRNAILYHAADQRIPDSLLFNVPEMFGLIKTLASTNGSLFYINGQDWWPHRQDVLLVITSFMSVLKHDPQAAFLERSALSFLGRMHARFKDGSAWQPHEFNYREAEEELIARYAELYLLHRKLGDGAEPVTREEYVRRECGTKVFEAGGFVVHRTPDKFASFTWGNGAMGLVYPVDDTWFTSPSERSMVGRIALRGVPEKQPHVTAHHVRLLADGFAATARIARCEGRIEQSVAMISLPGSPVIWLERLIARQEVEVSEIATGLLAVLNEDAGSIHANSRMIDHALGRQQIIGVSEAPESILQWKTPWINIDGRFGVLCAGSEVMAYRDNNQYARCRLEEELIPNYRDQVGHVTPGQGLSTCAVAYLPGASKEHTEGAKLECEATPAGLVAARLQDTVVAVNFSDSPQSATLLGRSIHLEPMNTVLDPN